MAQPLTKRQQELVKRLDLAFNISATNQITAFCFVLGGIIDLCSNKIVFAEFFMGFWNLPLLAYLYLFILFGFKIPFSRFCYSLLSRATGSTESDFAADESPHRNATLDKKK